MKETSINHIAPTNANMMLCAGYRVLVACEESQTVTKAFRSLGYEAFSCDLLPCSGGHPEWHFQCDVFNIINDGWDLMIAHPECTRLTVTANKWYKPEFSERFPTIHEDREKAADFFMMLMNADIPKIAIENPIGIMSTRFRKPDQIIQPYYFGDTERKSTCLWLKGLPKLFWSKQDDLFGSKTSVIPEIMYHKSGRTDGKLHFETLKLPKEERRKARSVTFGGIANAMASQWGTALLACA